MKMNANKRLAYVTMLSALSIVINLFESLFIPPIQFGIRFGLANIIALVTINIFGVKELVIVNTMRIVIGSLLRGVIFGSPFWISFGGVVFSTIAIIVAHKLKTSHIFMSILSALAHSFGQVLVVMALYNQSGVIALFPVLAVSSVATGILTGAISRECLKRIKR
ncbi:MAG: Gx transporter family protein [Firmicutes bacterium]|nr:Gx transporter family protein [Bacillota bacterium]